MALDEASAARAAEEFLAGGAIPTGVTADDLARECDRQVRSLTQESADEAVRAGCRWVEAARAHGGTLLCTALRASAWAHLVAGRYRDACDGYLEARRMLAGDRLACARIDRVLIDAFMYLDDTAEARKRGIRALAAFRRADAPADVAKTQVNLANLLHRQDRHVEAERLYAEAGRYFEQHGPPVAAALCDYNRANALVQLFDFARAEDLYDRARTIFLGLQQKLHATSCLYGTAWLHMLQGDFHQALLELSECEQEYLRGHHERELVVCHLDRAEAYLGLNLFPDARDAASEAAAGAARLDLGYEAAKAAFFEGRALLAMGQRAAARKRLRQAESGFAASGNEGFRAAVDLTLALAEPGARHKRSRINELRTRFRRAQLPLWEAICDLQILSIWPDESAAFRRVQKNPAAGAIPHLLARRHSLIGDRWARRNRMRSAVKQWALAADVLDLVRAKLPPIEMRSSYFALRGEPHQKLIEVEAERDPLAAAAWSERFKTAGIWSPTEAFLEREPARRRVHENLARLAGRMSALSGSIADPAGKRSLAAPGRTSQLREIERRVRDELAGFSRTAGSTVRPEPAMADAIRKLSLGLPVVQFHVARTDLLAFVHHRGESRTHRFRDGVRTLERLLARWRHLIEFAAVDGRPADAARFGDEHDLLAEMADLLLPPLELPSAATRLLILPEGLLFGIPWPALPVGSQHLVDHYELTLAPSLTHYFHASGRRADGKGLRLFVGSREDLPFVEAEVEAVRRRFDGPGLTVHDPCRRADWPRDRHERLWHFAGHAALRRDNPFYSALMLSDGPLFAADLRLLPNRVDLVTLAACRTGQHTGVPGEEASALVSALLEMGARNVLASHWAIADRSTASWMDHFYRHYLDGASAARAVREAVQGVREEFPSVYDWGAFSLFGAG